MTAHTFECLVVGLFFLIMIFTPALVIWKLCSLGEKVLKKLEPKKTSQKYDPRRLQLCLEGVTVFVCGIWALKKAGSARSEKEGEFFRQLYQGSLERVAEVNSELEGSQNRGFYSNPDWWKNRDDEIPPFRRN